MSPICGAAASLPIPTIFGRWGNLADIIIRAEWHIARLRHLGLTGIRKLSTSIADSSTAAVSRRAEFLGF
jgi:hypothetical protein